jgi:hypothetical protein
MTTMALGATNPARSNATKVHAYRLFGLEVHSEIELGELVAVTPGRPDLRIVLGRIAQEIDSGPSGRSFRFGANERLLCWPAVGKFLLRGGREIVVDPADGVEHRLLAFPLLGPVMALTMHDRGAFVLHASAVSVDGRGAGFLGDKGAGKSTTAAAMIAAGHSLVTDDVLAMSAQGAAYLAEAAFPQVKLASDAAAAISVSGAETQPPVHPAIEKGLHRLTTGFAGEATVMRRLFVIERGEALSMTRLPASDAFRALAQFSYVARFGRDALQGSDGRRHLEQCAALTRQIGAWRLTVPAGLDRIGEVVRAVERELAAAQP